jgi:hypothetical protein
MSDLTAIKVIRDTPQFRLFGNLEWGDIAKESKSFSADDQAFLAKTFFGWYEAGSTSPLPAGSEYAKMRALNPDMRFLCYVNSSATDADIKDVQLCEKDRLHMIQHYREGVLIGDINETVTTIHYNPTALCALISSTESGDLSTSLDKFVIWVVLTKPNVLEGAEVCKVKNIDKSNPNDVVLTVIRGFGGTTPARHSAGDLVAAPIYQSLNYPKGTSTQRNSLRYSIIPNSPAVMNAPFMVDKMTSHMVDALRDGPMLDLFSPSFYEMKNPIGGEVIPWNFLTAADLTKSERCVHKLEQGQLVASTVTAKAGRAPFRMGNNLNGDYEVADGGGKRVMEAGALELVQWEAFAGKPGGGFVGLSTWKKNLREAYEIIQNDWGIVVSCKPDPDYTLIPPNYAAFDAGIYNDFVSVGLVWDPSKPKPRVGFVFMVDPAGGPVGPGNWKFHVHPCWYYDAGVPLYPNPILNAEDPNALDPLKVPGWDGKANGLNSYWRVWSRVIFVQNPTTNSDGKDIVLPADRKWRDFADNKDKKTLRMAAGTSKCLWAWDYRIAANAPAGTNLGTVVGTHGVAPYQYALLAPYGDFRIDSNTGVLTNSALIPHVWKTRYPLNIKITDNNGTAVTVEKQVITKQA